MQRSGKLKIIFYINILIVCLLIFYKIYLNFFERDFQAIHAVQVERIEAVLKDKSSFSFAVVGNINNSIGIFERKILPLLNESRLDFLISSGNAVSSGEEDKYRALHRTLGRLKIPYLLTYGENEHSAFGGFRFYDHYGPYVFAFSAGNSRFLFLDGTGKTSWNWQFRWLEEELAIAPNDNIFVFIGLPIKPVDKAGIWDFDADYLIDEDIGIRLAQIVEQNKTTAVFSANLPVFSIQEHSGTRYVVTGGGGGLVRNNERSFYHYVQVSVNNHEVIIQPKQLEIGQHPVFRTLESLWFFIHSFFYVGYLNFILLLSFFIVVGIWLYYGLFVERNYYPNFDLPSAQDLNRTIKVVMFTNNYLPFIGGVPISIHRLTQSLLKLGHEVLIVAPKYSDSLEPEDEKHVVRLPSFFKFGKKGEMRIANIFHPGVFRAVKHFEPDVIHIHHPFWIGSLGMFIAKRLDIPTVYTYHTRLEHFHHTVPLPGVLFRNIISHTLIRRFANRCGSTIVPSESAEYYLRMIGVKNTIFVQPTGIDFAGFQNVKKSDIHNLRVRFGITGEKVLISVSRLSKEKNIHFIIDAIHKLKKDCPTPFKLIIVGDGKERDILETKIMKLGLEQTIILAGAVPHQNIPAYYRLGDVFVFASRAETQGMVILEAMAVGLPVVAVRSSGIDDFIKNGANGFKTMLNHEEWNKSIKSLLANPELRATLGANAQEYAKAYDTEKFGRQITQIYSRVVSMGANK